MRRSFIVVLGMMAVASGIALSGQALAGTNVPIINRAPAKTPALLPPPPSPAAVNYDNALATYNKAHDAFLHSSATPGSPSGLAAQRASAAAYANLQTATAAKNKAAAQAAKNTTQTGVVQNINTQKGGTPHRDN
jgi:hypothetical protein